MSTQTELIGELEQTVGSLAETIKSLCEVQQRILFPAGTTIGYKATARAEGEAWSIAATEKTDKAFPVRNKARSMLGLPAILESVDDHNARVKRVYARNAANIQLDRKC